MIRIRSRDGQAFRRAGLAFDGHWCELSDEDLSAEQLTALKAEPALEVQEVVAEPQEPAPKATKKATAKTKAAAGSADTVSDDGVA